MKRTEDFTLGEIANGLRHFIFGLISDRARINKWKASIVECKTNTNQDALFLKISVDNKFYEIAKQDFSEAVEIAKNFFKFEFQLNELSLEVSNIRDKD
ncbi:hypothetical protein [Aliarcobacter butzleri]|uniref:hypothetical protein n=1 Tax=Aliarcobacter butzleri TaxID=28197 RepID=UPI00126A77FB|nr:hypothetical protein [Aliarcobacter butzleri]